MNDSNHPWRDRYLDLVHGRARGVTAGLLRMGLWAASWFYSAGVRLRNALYDWSWRTIHRVRVPVISIGNLTVGGTGKTPAAEYIAGYYRSLGLRVAILSRGYGEVGGRNDEARVLEANLPDVPHLQGADRVGLANIAVEELESQVLVLDDGFQHRRLGRDLDLVLIDATSPWGLGSVLPRGLLREPVGGVGRADAVLLTRCDQVEGGQRRQILERIRRLAPRAVIASAIHQPVELTNAEGHSIATGLIEERPCAAFCGIGNPEGFRRTLLDLGGDLRAWRTFPDHHPYKRPDVQALHDWASALPEEAVILTTQKDLVKLMLVELAGRPLWSVRIRLAVEENEEALQNLLHDRVVKQLEEA